MVVIPRERLDGRVSTLIGGCRGDGHATHLAGWSVPFQGKQCIAVYYAAAPGAEELHDLHRHFTASYMQDGCIGYTLR